MSIFKCTMKNISEDKIKNIGAILNNNALPLKQRFRALFTLRNIGGPAAIQEINTCFTDSSALLKHELAYCLGQMQDESAIPTLIKVLEDVNQEPMVRHEAAEALGAIGSTQSVDVLRKYSTDPVVEVAETCELALQRIDWLDNKTEEKLPDNPYCSVDPAPPSAIQDVQQLHAVLLDDGASLFDRYRAMFALRNIKTTEAVLALGSALRTGSALFRHEIAFVLGQMQDVAGFEALRESLEDPAENEMVRHECAEALGAIATDECVQVLNKYLADDKRVVKESCEVALDMSEYENSAEFQYADTLATLPT